MALVVGDVASPFFPDVVRGIEDVLSPDGYSLILSSSTRTMRGLRTGTTTSPSGTLNRRVASDRLTARARP